MTWQDDPYEWIDPEKGRQGGVLAPRVAPEYPLPDAFKLRSLHDRTVDAIFAYAKRLGIDAARNRLIQVANVKRLSDVPDDQLPAVLEAFSK